MEATNERPAGRLPRARGMALAMVLVAVSTAALLGYTLLATAAVESKVSGNNLRIVQMQYLAESGLNLAAYYVQHPDRSPVMLVKGTSGDWHYGGESGIALAGLPGTFDIAVANPVAKTFSVVATARLNGQTRQATATFRIVRSLPVERALYVRGNMLLYSGLQVTAGGMTDDGTLVLALLGQVNGPIVARAAILPLGGTATISNDAWLGNVRPSEITMYASLPSYQYQGKTYTAKKVQGSISNTTLLDPDTAANPANVWYIDSSNRTFSGNVTLAGTLATKGSRSVKIAGNLTITPKPGMPGLLVGDDVIFSGDSHTLTVNGIAHIAGQVTGPALSASDRFVVNGALYLDQSASPVAALFHGPIQVTLVPENAKVVDFAPTLETNTALQVLSWND